MSTQNKPRLITSFEKLDLEMQEQIKLDNPEGFSENLIKFTNRDGELISALRFETELQFFS